MLARVFALLLGGATLALVGVVLVRLPPAREPARVTAVETTPRLAARGLPSSLPKPAEARAPLPVLPLPTTPSDAPAADPPSGPVPVAPTLPPAPGAPALSDEDRRRHDDVMAAIAKRERAASGLSIDMYSTSWCGACKEARLYMQGHGIAFNDHDIEQDPEALARQLALNPNGSVPTIDVDGREVLVGFSERGLDAAIARAAAADDGT
jgi:glutaredoxin